MEWYEIVISICSGLAVAIPLVVELIKWVQKAIQEKNWGALVELVMRFMEEAEVKFQTGAEKKDYVLMAIKASADTIDYKIDMNVVSKLIDDLCAMSKVVNPPKEEQVQTEA